MPLKIPLSREVNLPIGFIKNLSVRRLGNARAQEIYPLFSSVSIKNN